MCNVCLKFARSLLGNVLPNSYHKDNKWISLQLVVATAIKMMRKFNLTLLALLSLASADQVQTHLTAEQVSNLAIEFAIW